jgi:NAD(P)H-nitrite reductase large subunit
MQGARSIEALGAACGAGTGCGACHEMLDQMASEGSAGGGQAGSSRCHSVTSAVPFPSP